MTQFDFASASTARKSITLILGIILFTGTITSFYTSSSSSFIRNAQAQSVDNVLDDIDCDNINLNGNDISIDALPPSLGVLADLIQTEAGDSSISNTEQRAIDDFIFKCINNNQNEFSESQTPTPLSPVEEGATLSISKEWFVCNNEDIDCIVESQEEGEQISFQGPNSGMYIQCTSDTQCPFANDAGFNIEITGNSPTPNTIPAQINTMQDVEIGAGLFEVTEELFSNRFVPNADFDVEDVPVGDILGGIIPPPLIITFDEAGQRVFIANFGSDSVSIIDLTTTPPTVTDVDLAASGGNSPFAIAFDEAGQRVFTANFGSDSVSIIDLTTTPATVTDVDLLSSGGDGPFAIAFDEEGQRVFTANTNSDSVSIIDLTTTPPTVTDVDLLSSGGDDPVAIAFDEAGQRVFTANSNSDSISIIDLTTTPPTVTDVDLAASGGSNPVAIAFDEAGQRVFTANLVSDSVSIIDLTTTPPTVTDVDLLSSGGDRPIAIAFDEIGQRLFTANIDSNSVSIIDLTTTPPTVTDVDLAASGGDAPLAIAFDEAGQRVFTANFGSDSVSIIDLPTVAKICQDSGFDTGDIRTFVSNGQTIQQITCVNFVGECFGNIDNGETRECTVEDYVVSLDEVSTNGESEIDILSSNMKNSQQLLANDISSTENKIQTLALPTGPVIYEVPKH